MPKYGPWGPSRSVVLMTALGRIRMDLPVGPQTWDSRPQPKWGPWGTSRFVILHIVRGKGSLIKHPVPILSADHDWLQDLWCPSRSLKIFVVCYSTTLSQGYFKLFPFCKTLKLRHFNPKLRGFCLFYPTNITRTYPSQIFSSKHRNLEEKGGKRWPKPFQESNKISISFNPLSKYFFMEFVTM